MLDAIKISANNFNLKCAEIHYNNAEKYAIICSYCDLITNCFDQFREHYQGLHLEIEHLANHPKCSNAEDDKYWSLDDENSVHRDDQSENVYVLENEAVPEEKNETLENIKILLSDGYDLELNEGLTQIDVELNVADVKKENSIEFASDSEEDKEWSVRILPQSSLPIHNNEISEYEATRDDHSVAANQTTSARKFKCQYCEKSFSYKSNRNMHEVRHTEKRNFGCSICRKSFYTQCELRNHMRWHTDERSYVCEECGKAFRHSWVLRKHHRTHTTKKATLPCPQCGKLFTYKDNLRNHLQIHKTSSSFTCEWCNRSFTQRKLLRAHTQRHHANHV